MQAMLLKFHSNASAGRDAAATVKQLWDALWFKLISVFGCVPEFEFNANVLQDMPP